MGGECAGVAPYNDRSITASGGNATITIRAFAGSLAVTCAFLAAAPPATAQKAVLIVRHGERQDDSEDTPLSAAGRARAERLASALRDAGVTAIFATQWQRTGQTVAPLATALKLPIQQVHSDDIDGLVATLRAKHAGGIVLVASHSGSAPKILAALGVPGPVQLGDDEFDNLFVVVPGAGPAPTFLRLHY